MFTRIEGIDADLGKSLKAKLADSSFMDADLLENLAKRVEETDAIFASNMRVAATRYNKEIGQSGLYHFGYLYRDAAKMFDNNVRKMLVRVAEGDPSLTVNELTNTQKVAIAMRVRKADTFYQVAQLRQYEMEKELLTELSAGKPTIAEVKKSLQKLTDEVPIDAEDYLARADNLMDSSDYFVPGLAGVDPNASKRFLKSIEAEESLLGQPLPTVEKIHKIAAYKEAIRKYETDGFKLESALSEIDGRISGRHVELYDRVAYTVIPPVIPHDILVDYKEIRFWHKITSTIELRSEARKSRIASLKRDIGAFEADLRVKTAKFDAANEAARVSRDRDAQLEKLLTERQSNVVQRLREGAQATVDGNTARVQELRQVAGAERQAWGLSGLAAGLGATAVFASLDKSIWGYGEKQLGKHWSQIFNDKASFADAVSVTNLPAVLNKLADVLGHKVNTAALKL